jgi:hypothetical protein
MSNINYTKILKLCRELNINVKIDRLNKMIDANDDFDYVVSNLNLLV